MQLKKKYIVLTILLFIIEVLIAIYFDDRFIRPHVGDFLVVIFIYCLIRGFFDIGVLKAAVFVLIFSYVVEFLQYMKIVEILRLQNYRIARIIIGTSFSWIDIVCYSLGIFTLLVFEWKSISAKND